MEKLGKVGCSDDTAGDDGHSNNDGGLDDGVGVDTNDNDCDVDYAGADGDYNDNVGYGDKNGGNDDEADGDSNEEGGGGNDEGGHNDDGDAKDVGWDNWDDKMILILKIMMVLDVNCCNSISLALPQFLM